MNEWQTLYRQLPALTSQQELVDTVLPALAHLLAASGVALYLTDHQDARIANLAGQWGQITTTGPLEWVLHQGQPLVNTASAATNWLFVPLQCGTRNLGVLSVERPVSAPFTPTEVAAVQTLAGSLALVVDNLALRQDEGQQAVTLIRDQLQKFARLYEISARLHTARELEPLLHTAAADIAQVFAATAVEITLFDTAGELTRRMAVGLAPTVLQETTPRPGGSIHTIWRTGQPLLVSDVSLAPAMLHPRLRQAGLRAFVGLPLLGRERVLGVVRVLFDQPQPLLWNLMNPLATCANQVAIAIENLYLYQRLEDLLTETIRALVHAFEAKDPYSARHSEEVMRYAVALARELGFDEARCRVIRFGALLHDIGKIGVGDQILLKEAILDTREWSLMRTHPTLGAEIVTGIRPLRDVVNMVRHHHERFDGLGYPEGLAGEAIPLEARLLAVVDAFESMTSDRAYRQAISVDEALARLEAGADRQWDGRIVRVWCDLVRREGRKLLGVKWDLLVQEASHRPRPPVVHCPSLSERSSTACLPGEEIRPAPAEEVRRAAAAMGQRRLARG